MGQKILCKRGMGICVFCPRYYSKDTGAKLPCILGAVGIVFSDTCSMGNNSSFIRNECERKNSGSDFVLHDFGGNFLCYIPTVFKKIFSEINLIPQQNMTTFVGWKIFYFLGFSLTGMSYWMASKAIILDLQISDTPIPFQNVVYFLTSVFILILCLRSIGKFIEQCIRIKDAVEELRHKKYTRNDETKPETKN